MRHILIFSIVSVSMLFGADIERCVHFLDRTSFGADRAQLERCLASDSYEAYVKSVVYDDVPVNIAPPKGMKMVVSPPEKTKQITTEERMKRAQQRRKELAALQLWWLQRIIDTQHPFREHMTLFWHAHFTTELRKVKQPVLMFNQYELLSRNALGNFGTMLHGIVKDPAMLIYLDNTSNNKDHPNENLARELLELYTMGEGHYSETDIKELARALTGFGVDKQKNFAYRNGMHDKRPKTLFGRSGNFDADSAVDVILNQEATARYIVTKFWKTFIGEKTDDKEIARLSNLFRQNGYELKPLLFALFTSPAFTDPTARGRMIKSPIELIVGMLRTFDYPDFDPKLALRYTRTLGQEPFNPPNVRGWRQGIFWIDTTTLLQRRAFIEQMARDDMIRYLNPAIFDLAPKGTERESFAAEVLLPADVFIAPGSDFNATLRTILRDPLYQLK